jgi:hypothetical protein
LDKTPHLLGICFYSREDSLIGGRERRRELVQSVTTIPIRG